MRIRIFVTIASRTHGPNSHVARAYVLPLCLVIVLISSSITTWAQSELPPNVQADILKQQIFDAVKNNRSEAVLEAAKGYHKLESKGIQVPPGVLYLEATTANETGDHLRAFDSLTAYLKVAQPSDHYYKEALRLYPLYAANPQVVTRTAAREAEAVSRAKLKRKADEESAREAELRSGHITLPREPNADEMLTFYKHIQPLDTIDMYYWSLNGHSKKDFNAAVTGCPQNDDISTGSVIACMTTEGFSMTDGYTRSRKGDMPMHQPDATELAVAKAAAAAKAAQRQADMAKADQEQAMADARVAGEEAKAERIKAFRAKHRECRDLHDEIRQANEKGCGTFGCTKESQVRVKDLSALLTECQKDCRDLRGPIWAYVGDEFCTLNE